MMSAECPRLGLVPPTKEVSSIPSEFHGEKKSDILRLVGRWPDAPPFFLAVYHHTTLSEEMQPSIPPRQGETRYTSITPFPDPMTLLAQFAQEKKHNELFTAVMVAPQLQTPTLAQQVAALANLSEGRFRFGVGVGWNEAEYRAVGMEDRFHRRGKILNLQIPAIEMMLTGRVVNLTIGSEKIDNMAINPHSQHEVPIWVGGLSVQALERAAIYGNGWMPLGDVGPFIEGKQILLRLLETNRRAVEHFGFMGRITLGTKTIEACVDDYLAWIDAGVTHIALTTTGQGNPNWEHHSDLIYQFLKATRWIRYADSEPFGSLFGSGTYRAPEGLFANIVEKSCITLEMAPKYLIWFLNDHAFVSIKDIPKEDVRIPSLSPSLLKVTGCYRNSDGYSVWLLETQQEKLPRTIVVYDSALETRFMKSSQ